MKDGRKYDKIKQTNTDIIDLKDWYTSSFDTFENQLNGSSEIPFHRTRQTAMERLSQIGFPSRRSEDWKYTDLTPLLQQRLCFAPQARELKKEEYRQFSLDKECEAVIVFVNGQFSRDLSKFPDQPGGLTITPLEELLRKGDSLVTDHLARYADFQDEPFTALNTAFAREGLVIHLAPGHAIEKPIQVLHLSDPRGEAYQSHHRNLFIAGQSSQATILETRHHLSDASYFQNTVTEMLIQENANLNFYSLQDESRQSYLISRLQVHQETGSIFSHVAIDLGGSLVRNNLGIALDGENSEAHLYGFYLSSGTQHLDNHTNIDHLKPHCQSNELYKGILTDQGRGVFSGTIYVARDAQKTNAFQANRSLILSEQAEVDSKPQLKIFADDVKCTHGATIGQMDEEAIFYLQQRGIDREEAYTLLRTAFAGEVFEKIRVTGFRQNIENMVGKRLRKEFSK